jgi:hypothetical protein
MESQNLLLILTLIAVIVAMVNMFTVVLDISDFRRIITGRALDTELGYINLTIQSITNINLSRNNSINWGSGVVNTTGGWTNATLYTKGIQAPNTTLGGNWSCPQCKGFLIENIGNTNCTQLNISSGNNSVGFFGSASGTNQSLQFNLTENESNSCTGNTTQFGNQSSFTLGWFDANTSNTTLCAPLRFDPTKNAVNLDVLIAIPFDSNRSGAISNIVRFYCYA